MLPSVVASQVRRAVEDYLLATFPPESPAFRDLWSDFFKSKRALFRGPYLSLKFPFRLAERPFDYFESGIELSFPPYAHQAKAFRRLCGSEPCGTIVATGTGSGKTECFLYPILDYCRRTRFQPGVKAIVVYPMNALATDQARRFAKEIYSRESLRGNVSVGLFVGGESAATADRMTDEFVIADKETMRKYPPNVLLTNYKMLDYLMARAKDYELWRKNEPGTLRYVVVDELHTFDGAQGTDLACLLRRLYDRLGTRAADVFRVGTSATLGDSEEDRAKLRRFAENVFGGTFDENAIIVEDLLDSREFLERSDALTLMRGFPEPRDVDKLDFENYATPEEYLRAQVELWFGNEIEYPERTEANKLALGRALQRLPFVRNLFRIMENEALDVDEISRRFDGAVAKFSELDERYRTLLFDSIFALISEARREIEKTDGGKAVAPFLRVRAQLWTREMARVVASVEEKPKLYYDSDVKRDDPKRYLPLVHCRSCGRVGYLSFVSPTGYRLSRNLPAIYDEFFRGRAPVCVFFDEKSKEPSDENGGTQRCFDAWLCSDCLTLDYGESVKKCSRCGSERLLKVEKREISSPSETRRERVCPYCGADELAIVGARAASLTSVAISQMFATKYNDEENKKLLAFSDSVQDASHRAGFFEGRTYRFNLRAAIQQALERRESPTLAEAPKLFVDYWLEKFRGSKARFVAQFIAPDLQNYEYDELKKQGERLPAKDLNRLYDKVVKRVGWEIVSEYGFLSQIGRTLEKSSCSIAALRREERERWIGAVWERLRNEIGELRSIERLDVARLALGFARNLRVRGGVCVDCLSDYMKSGNSFELRKTRPFLPKFGYARAPIFIQTRTRVADRFDFLPGAKSRPSFYRVWLKQTLGAKAEYYCEDVFRVVLEEGLNVGIFRREKSRGGEVWGLDPATLVIENEVDRFSCDKTNRTISTPRSEREFWQNAPNGRAESSGKLRLREEKSRNYYGALYRRADVCRVIAREHTGLLKRQKRESLETEFIDGDRNGRVAATNALSCTPTLEMGINIGDLSCVVLCSMPPTRSNYVQRIGRGGRRDGNALNLVVATNQAHDLYFYNEPREMFAGSVTPPGVFLNAPAVLERQLTAFCFDRWIVEIEGDKTAVPERLKGVLDSNSNATPNSFPRRFVDYIAANRDELFRRFCGIFQDVFADDTIEALRRFFYNSAEGGLDYRISARIDKTRREREGYRTRRASARGKYIHLEGKPQDENAKAEIKELQIETRALGEAIKSIDEKSTYNFFTDEGLLPNYAFPEAGVALRSVLWRKKNVEGKAEYDTSTDEYERPAGAAISELAPGNDFYVGGRKLTINRVDISGDFQLEDWRFCGSCNHIEKIGKVPSSATVCPNCGSPTWGDGALNRRVLKLNRVIANQSDEETKSFDEKDNRAPTFFDKETMVDFPSLLPEKAYRIDDGGFPFGFEYWRDATFREINFGAESFQGENIEVAGKKKPSVGFRVCRECGATQNDNGEFKHHVSCKYYRKTPEKGIVDCIYLYREFRSEAIRILLPFDDFDLDVKEESFIAAVYIGLKERFGGVDHLKIVKQSEPLPGVSTRKPYLVLYDQIPGGSGYLKQLVADGRNFIDVLQAACDKIRSCVCQNDEEKDGCYRCLLAYNVSRDAPNIKRSEALATLGAILSRREKLRDTQSLDKVDMDVVCESELEKQFLEALSKYNQNQNDANVTVDLEKALCEGKPGYLLTINDRRYSIVPQAELGPENGVAVKSRADFLIRPVRNQADFLPIAVFTDGFRYHADLASNDYRLPRDVEQRTSIVRSSAYRCWSLSYNDVQTALGKSSKSYWEKLVEKQLTDVTGEIVDKKDRDVLQYPFLDAFRSLIRRLAFPNETNWFNMNVDVVVSLLHTEPVRTTVKDGERLLDAIRNGESSQKIGEIFQDIKNAPPVKPERFVAVLRKSEFYLIVISADNIDITNRNWDNVDVELYLDDSVAQLDEESTRRFQRDWNSWLNAFNLLQYLPKVKIRTSRFAKAGLNVVEWTCLKDADDEQWNEFFELVDPIVVQEFQKSAIKALLKANAIAVPTVGFELGNEDGEVVAESELAWEEEKVAVLLDSNGRDAFESAGWRVFDASEDNWAQRTIDLVVERRN